MLVAGLSAYLGACHPPVRPLPGSTRDASVERRLRQAAEAHGHADATWVNRLILEQSPYLLQHATNPVDWYPWGEEAFAKARQLDRLVFLSVGYSTCHWCHVMAHESFEDPQIAALINEHYVPVKVDREERPDVDEVYMAAVTALNRGRGGWPMTVVMTPDGQPVFAATYLPPRDGDRGARRGLTWVLEQIVEDWGGDRTDLLTHADQITAHLVRMATPTAPEEVPPASTVSTAVSAVMEVYDADNGGFGSRPKFPKPVLLDLLVAAGDDDAVHAALHTLKAMHRGGIHDQVGGGFHRYATDASWRVPHFEKMLYDNAQLLSTAADLWQATADPQAAAVAHRTAAYLLEEMVADSGALYSATDADSRDASGELSEGAYFTWTPAEVAAVLAPADASQVSQLLGITAQGNLQGRSVAYLPRWPTAPEQQLLQRTLPKLREARAQRPAPQLDDKHIAAWNAYAISALARAGMALDQPQWIEAAVRAADFVCTQMVTDDGRLRRVVAQGASRHAAVLEDEAAMAVAALDVLRATSDPRWLDVALARLAVIEAHFADARGGWFRTAHDGETLLVRHKPDSDGAEPSGTALAVEALLRVSHLTSDPSHQATADRALAAYAPILTRAPTAMAALMRTLALRHAPPQEVVVVWPAGSRPAAEPLLTALRSHWLPTATRVTGETAALRRLEGRVPWVEGKVPQDDRPTAYVCEGGVCQRPTTDPAVLAELLRASR